MLRFYNTLVSKAAAMLKIVYSRYIYRECNVLVPFICLYKSCTGWLFSHPEF